MLPLTTILVPVDFGDSSREAVSLALAWAQRFDATVVLMHAYEVPSFGNFSYPRLPSMDLATTIEKAATLAMEAETRLAMAAWPKVRSVLRAGSAWREILAVAEAEKADLIIMGTHGRTGLAHALLGSVAEHVVRAAAVPVLTVRGQSAEDAPAKPVDEADALEARLARPSIATMEAAALSGAVAGITLGAFAGPAGIVAGGWVGSAIGSAAGAVLTKEDQRARAATAQLDADVGIIGGDIGAARPKPRAE